jgi:hypothetical protein
MTRPETGDVDGGLTSVVRGFPALAPPHAWGRTTGLGLPTIPTVAGLPGQGKSDPFCGRNINKRES